MLSDIESALAVQSSRADACVVMQCMQALPQMYVHSGMPTSFEPGIVLQPSGVVHHGCTGLPVVDVHPYFTECLDAHQIVVSHLCLSHCECICWVGWGRLMAWVLQSAGLSPVGMS